jgi:hypothetical protein
MAVQPPESTRPQMALLDRHIRLRANRFFACKVVHLSDLPGFFRSTTFDLLQET